MQAVKLQTYEGVLTGCLSNQVDIWGGVFFFCLIKRHKCGWKNLSESTHSKHDVVYDASTVCMSAEGGGGVGCGIKAGPGLNQKQRHFPLEKQWEKAKFTWANWQSGGEETKERWMDEWGKLEGEKINIAGS